MLLTKQNIVSRINQLQKTFKVKWEDIYIDLDMAIDKINDYMGTKYPPVSSVLDDYALFEKTYSYRAGGSDIPFFPEKYFHNIVIPFVITQILAKEEEFTTVYSKYLNDINDSLLTMVALEINNVPSHLIDIPQGVYFANPNPTFKESPEAYFNRKIQMPVPKIKVSFSWGDIDKGFVAKPLPLDFNSYEIGMMYIPPIMQTNEELTLLLDEEGTTLATFVGWSLERSGQQREIINSYIELKEDVTFYAVWDYDIIRFKYNGNGGALTNWRPLYVNKNAITQDVYPFGGTAVRVGFKFVGFDPIKIGPDDITNTSIDMTDGFSLEELEEINEYGEEAVVEFVARWERVKYKLNFSVNSPNVHEYVYGQEFVLLPPTLAENSIQEFIGWWDNSSFSGDPVTNIFESDYGDKTFYAKFNPENYRVLFKNEDNSIISMVTVPKNSLVNAPLVNDKPNGDIDGKLFSFTFDKFIDQQGNPFTNDYRITRNTEFTATFIQRPIEKYVYINYKTEDSHPNYVVATIFNKFQVGETVDVNLLRDIVSQNDFGDYVNSGTDYVIDGLSLTSDGSKITNFTMPNNDVNLFSIYSTTFITLTFYRKIWNGTSVVVDPNQAFTKKVSGVSPGYPSSSIKNIVDLTNDVLVTTKILAYINKTPTEYLDDFREKDVEESVLPQYLTISTDIVPMYSTTQNQDFVKSLTLNNVPNGTLENLYTPTPRIYAIGTLVDLEDIIDELNDDVSRNKYLTIDSFHSSPSLNIESKITQITMSTSQSIYAKTSSKSVYSVGFRFHIDSNYTTRQLVRKIYPFELASGLTINAATYLNNLIYSNETPSGMLFKGWSHIYNDTAVNQTITVDNSLINNVDFFPVFLNKLGFRVKTEFQYERTTVFPVTINKSLGDSLFNANQEGNIVTLYSGAGIIETLLASWNMPGGLNNLQLRGLEVYEYMSWIGGSPYGWYTFSSNSPMYVGLPMAKETETVINTKISMRRKSNYMLFTIESLTGLSGAVERDLKSFHSKGLTWGVIKASLPALAPYCEYRVRNMYGQFVSVVDSTTYSSDQVIKAVYVSPGVNV